MTLERFPQFLLSQLKLILLLGGRNWWISAFVWLITIAPAQAASLELRVAIEDGASEVTVGSSTRAVVRDGAGRALGEVAAMNAFVAEPRQGKVALDRWQAGQIWVEPTEGGYVYIGDSWYRGRTLVVPTAKGLTAVNYVDLEQYLYSVLGGEMSGGWPQEALKAQAVAARSYALYQRQRSANGTFDVGDTPAWQVYDGIEDESIGTQAAVNATAGQVLTYSGQIIEAVFHSSAGGCTENVEDVWMQPLPYLRSVKENFKEVSPVATWTETFSRDQFSQLIPGVGNILSMEPVTTKCGRVKSMQVFGDKGQRTVSGDTLRSALKLKSTLFTVLPQAGANSGKEKSQLPALFQVTGHGFGHGLGLSQYGAKTLAERGENYQYILSYYYKNTTLAKIQVK